MNTSLPKTIGELIEFGYITKSVKQEIRSNLISKLQNGVNVFPQIIGFEETVIPQIQNAILAGQDIILLGERGQAKSKIIRNIIELFDEQIPYVAGSEINDDPLYPISKFAKDIISEMGNSTPIEWLHRHQRYSEKLATPDVSVADLIGEIDPIKIAEGLYLSDEMAIHYGMVPRANRGLFCINELPDLTERIQVSLFNLMQERDIQIKGHKIRLNLDVIIVATANPEDYTNRGRIITPLKDRYGAQIRTHYPDKIDQEIIIIDQEYKRFPDSEQLVKMPSFMKEIIAEITHLARKSPEINQRSGVSLRVSIANYETLISQAYRRGIVNNYATSPRISELKYLIASSIGKLELETVEEGQESKIIGSIIDRAVLNIFLAKINPEQLTLILEKFETGLTVDVGENILDNQLVKKVDSIDGLRNILYGICNSEEDCVLATTFEFVLEGLHQTKKIGKAINDKSEVYTI